MRHADLYVSDPRHQVRLLYIMFKYDGLSTYEIARLIGKDINPTRRYLKAMRTSRYIVPLSIGFDKFWHILPRGIRRLSELLGVNKLARVGTYVTSQESKVSLIHDVACNSSVMRLIENSEEGARGITEWKGPILTRKLYTVPTEIGTTRAYYNPDAYIEYHVDGRWGSLDIEFDSGSQHLPVVAKKVPKAHAYWNASPNHNVGDHVIAFITLKGRERIGNIVNLFNDHYLNSPDPLLVIGTTYADLMDNDPWSNIWFANNGQNKLYSLADFTSRPIASDKEVLNIGSPTWRDMLYRGELPF